MNDWVGRCIAEKESALATVSVTLTYGGGDTPESRFLRKSDLAAFFKALSNDKHKVRYFATGEYGSEKGRAHWHAVLFWYTPMPKLIFDKNTHVDWWPHGHTFWQAAETSRIRYVMKYINKDDDGQSLKAMAMSRKPMLGTAFFERLAGRYIDQGLAPQRPFYKFRDVLGKDGRPLEFYMPPLVQERFAEAYMRAWRTRFPGRHWPNSDMIDKFHDKESRYAAPIRAEKFNKRDAPWMAPPGGAPERFDEKLNSFYAIVDGKKLYWSFNEQGQREWREKIVTESQAERLSERIAARRLAESEGRKT